MSKQNKTEKENEGMRETKLIVEKIDETNSRLLIEKTEDLNVFGLHKDVYDAAVERAIELSAPIQVQGGVLAVFFDVSDPVTKIVAKYRSREAAEHFALSLACTRWKTACEIVAVPGDEYRWCAYPSTAFFGADRKEAPEIIAYVEEIHDQQEAPDERST